MSSSLELVAQLWNETPAQRAWRMRCAYGLERSLAVSEIWLASKPNSPTEYTYYKQTLEMCLLQIRDALADFELELTEEGLEAVRGIDTHYDLLLEMKSAPKRERMVQLSLF